jgi:UDP-2-acetamido-3-amino-2,3-dideoxy-glucuronate N-acetyltransferase
LKANAKIELVPANQIGWMTHHGEKLEMPFSGDGEAACSVTGDKYKLSDGGCRINL